MVDVTLAAVANTLVAVVNVGAKGITASASERAIARRVAKHLLPFRVVATHAVAAETVATSANRSVTITEPMACTALFKVVRVVPAVEPMLADTNKLHQLLAKQSKEQQQWLSQVKSLPAKNCNSPRLSSATR